jgi:rare lipoprotein A (peptidoglycan hydrolase)
LLAVLSVSSAAGFAQEATVVYQVKKGDTLTKIALCFGTTVKDVVFLNNIKNPNLIRTGQILKIRPYNARKEVVASWYGEFFQNKPMANGEPFDRFNPIIAAHKCLPLGTFVKLTNDKGVSITVVIKDRGPYVSGRDFDLSEAAASILGYRQRGLASLKVEIGG